MEYGMRLIFYHLISVLPFHYNLSKGSSRMPTHCALTTVSCTRILMKMIPCVLYSLYIMISTLHTAYLFVFPKLILISCDARSNNARSFHNRTYIAYKCNVSCNTDKMVINRPLHDTHASRSPFLPCVSYYAF